MYLGKRVVVVVPCYNEETQIGKVVETMPPEVDTILIVDDCSKDKTVERVKALQAAHPRVVLLQHEKNQGVGGAIASGYVWALEHGADIAVVMAGDGQMPPEYLPALLEPVAKGEVEYTKGNRLLRSETLHKIPVMRLLGNSALSFLTKIASGYWHIIDSQNGYTAISRVALQAIDWNQMYKRYGQPNDLLVRLNICGFRVRDVPMPPVYGQGEQSKMKKRKVLFTLSWLLAKLFLWRMKEKYILRDFHPLLFFWFLGVMLLAAWAGLAVRLFYLWGRDGAVPEITAMACGFCLVLGLQSIFFALLFDMESNRHLK